MKARYLFPCLLVTASLSWAQTGYNARSLGLAGAYQGLARGAEVANWNPATLGLSDNPASSLDLLHLGAVVGNNVASLNLYNIYFKADAAATWTDQDKAEIMDQIPGGGLEAFSRAQTTLMGLSYRQYALAIGGFAYGYMKLPKNFVALPVNGLPTGYMDLSGGRAEGVVGAQFALSGAHSFDLGLDFVKEFSAGLTAKYLAGYVYTKSDYAGGHIDINTSPINGYIDMQGNGGYTTGGYPSASRGLGRGFGLDLGAAGRLSDKLDVGLAVNNFVGSIKFPHAEKKTGTYEMYDDHFDPYQFINFDAYLDSITTTTDTSYTAGDVTYQMPRIISLSATYRILPWLTAEADYQQGLNKTTGNSLTPRVAVGGEMSYLFILPVRVGLAFGGAQGFSLGFGFGLNLKHYQVDLGVANQQGFFNASKGLSLGISQRVVF